MVELKGARIDLDRKMPTRNITPVQQVWNYLNASDSAQWAMVCNYAEIRLYSRQKSSNPMHRVFLTELDDPVKFAEFYAIFHADSLLATGLVQNTGWLLKGKRITNHASRPDGDPLTVGMHPAGRRVPGAASRRVRKGPDSVLTASVTGSSWSVGDKGWIPPNGSKDDLVAASMARRIRSGVPSTGGGISQRTRPFVSPIIRTLRPSGLKDISLPKGLDQAGPSGSPRDVSQSPRRVVL